MIPSDSTKADDYKPEWDAAIVDGTNNNLTVTFTKKITPSHFLSTLPVNGDFTVPTKADYDRLLRCR